MENDFEELKILRNLEDTYEKVFTRNGMGRLMQMIWLNIKEDCSENMHILELCARLSTEELMIYAIAAYGEKGYNEMIKLKEEKQIKINMKPYKEVEEYYRNYIIKLKEYFEHNPREKDKIFNKM